VNSRKAPAALIATLAFLGLYVLPAAAQAAPPTLTVESVSNASYTSAEVTGKSVFDTEANGGSDGFRFFQWCHPSSPGECTETSGSWQNGPEAFGHVQSAGTEETVEEQLTGLPAGAEIVVRLVAYPFAGGEFFSPEPYESFETEAVAKPTISNFSVSNVSAEGAHFFAEVDPNGSASAFDASWRFECTPSCGTLSGPVVSGAKGPVEADATGLEPNTFYTVRLYAENAGGQTKDTETFQTGGAGPLVKAFAAGPVGPTTARINGEVDPRGSSTVYWFEWGTEDCSAPGASCQSIPAEHDASAGNGQLFKYVYRQLTGLTPGTTYHFRLVAENASGITEGPDEEFTTASPALACTNQGMPGTDFLPDCRAYELVSPPEKNGMDVLAMSSKTHVAADGNGAAFASIGGFGSVKGTSLDVEYLSRRDGQAGTNGWSTHGINPLGESITFEALISGNVPSIEAPFTPDLSGALYLSWRPLVDAPNVEDVTNLYRLRNLDSPTPELQLLTDSAAPLTDSAEHIFPTFREDALHFRVFYQGASTDLSHVVFQSPWNLSDGQLRFPGNLYEYVDGVGVRLVARIPTGSDTECDDGDGTPCVDAASSSSGIPNHLSTTWYSEGMNSEDGSRIVFQSPYNPNGGTIYMREDGVRTFQINASEKTTPDSPERAQAWGMTPDGSRVFFTTEEPLVEGAQHSPSLYMWDRTAPAGSRLTLLSGDSSGKALGVTGFVGASDDGRYVYFLANGQIVPGEPSEVSNGLYLWHDGQISYIGRFSNENEAAINTPRTNWGLATQVKPARVSPDGRFLLFGAESDAGFKGRGGFAGYDHGGAGCSINVLGSCRELYLYRADTGGLDCVSCNPRTDVASGDALTDNIPGTSISSITQHSSHALSDDGRRVFFNTPEALVSEDTNGTHWDAYEYDVPSRTVHLLSSGTDASDSYFLDASANGDDVFIVTRERLVGWDFDGSQDLYDVRVNGGFPEPPPQPAACTGESCISSPPPASAPPPTASESPGPGNPARRCPRGKHRRHGRCVAKHRKHRRHKHHRANHDRRPSR
jgi:hypothetical protein